MDRSRIIAIMGRPTETFPDQAQWSGFGLSLTAFFAADGRAYQLDSNSSGVEIPCETSRTANLYG